MGGNVVRGGFEIMPPGTALDLHYYVVYSVLQVHSAVNPACQDQLRI
jgi:hypothetical protein